MKRLVVLVVLIALLVPALAPAKDARLEALRVRLDRMFREAYPADEPGAAVLVVQDGRTVLRQGYGMADLELGVAVAPDMVFRLGSITKQFTAAVVMMLAEEGKLAIGDEVTKILPDYPTHGAHVTIEHLLTHTSGIPNYTDFPELMAAVRDDRTVEQMLAVFRDRAPEFAPGARWAYSNSGYVLLGAVIEKVTGRPYAEVVEERIFKPLGMTQSTYGDAGRVIPRRAHGYSRDGDHYVNAPYLSMTIPYSAGSLLSTVDDLAHWDAALYGETLLPRAARERMWTSYVLAGGEATGYGYGWSVGDYEGSRVIEHGGGIHGFATMAVRMPRERVFVAVLSNNPQHEPGPGFLARRAAALVIGKPLDRQEVTVAPEVLGRYVGVYRIDDDNERVVTLADGRLRSQRTGGEKLLVRMSSETEYFYDDSATHGRFVLADDGTVTGMAMTPWLRPEAVATRTDKPVPEAAGPSGGPLPE